MPHSRSRLTIFCALLMTPLLLAIAPGTPPQTATTPAPESSLSFAAFTDTHVGQQTIRPKWGYANHLDRLADGIMDDALPCEFVVHLGDGAYNKTAFVNGVGLPKTADAYKHNLKAFLVSHLHLPFHYVGGNIDLTDYSGGQGLPEHDNDAFVLLRTYVDETELNHYPYAMMRNGILFLALPEMDYEPWTRPQLYEWVQFMTAYYHRATTVIFSHQAIEDTTPHDGDLMSSYRGQQDQDWWARLFRENPQIKLWIHGHNHMPGWYIGRRSSGLSRPVQDFGHEIAFSAPHPQMVWANNLDKLDVVDIYTISATGVTSRAWADDGAGGHWVSGFDTTWQVPTTYDPNEEDWYSFPALIQDGETQLTDMKVLSSKVTLQLVGTEPMELFYDPYMRTKGIHVNENLLGFDDDPTDKVTANTPGMTVHGAWKLTFPPRHEWDKYCHDGHGGQPNRYFSVGTSPAAAPGGSYTFTITARSASGTGKIDLSVSASDWGTKSQYSTLAGSSRAVFSHRFGKTDETISGTYAVPNDSNAWFIHGMLDFADPTDYHVTYFSIKRTMASETTDNFRMVLSGKEYAVDGPLGRFKTREFAVDPVGLADRNGVITFAASIGGNHFGMARLIYHAPVLMGRNARYKLNSVSGQSYDITLTARLSGHSHTFEMFPFSTKYGGVAIRAEDGSGETHTSKNGNSWIACDCSTGGKRILVTYPTKTPQ